MKPILFNTEMVRAILDGRKTTTRRVIKPQPEGAHMVISISDIKAEFMCARSGNGWCYDFTESRKLPFHIGDILYVRETWRIQSAHRFEADAKIEFKASGPMKKIQFANAKSQSANRDDYDGFIGKWFNKSGWHPPLFMPKEAARIFLRVTDVKAERLQDITAHGAFAEGVAPEEYYKAFSDFADKSVAAGVTMREFRRVWDSTIKKSDLDKYGWGANPWVWVISFERYSKDGGKVM